MQEELKDINIDKLKECIENSKYYFIDISRSNIFIHHLQSKWKDLSKYNVEKNCFEFNITIEEAEWMEVDESINNLAYVSCPLMYWKTSFYWKKSNWILDFQKLVFDLIIILMDKSWMVTKNLK